MSDQKSKSMTNRLTEISSPGRERVMATQAETLEWHKKRWGQHSFNLLLSPLPCPAFSSLAMMEDSFSEWVFISESFKEDYILLLFLPKHSLCLSIACMIVSASQIGWLIKEVITRL